MDRIQQANQLVKHMIIILSLYDEKITITSDYDLEILQQCSNNLEVFLEKQQTGLDRKLSDKTYTDRERSTGTSQNKYIAETFDHYQKELHNLIENMESDGLSDITITSILKQGSKGYI